MESGEFLDKKGHFFKLEYLLYKSGIFFLGCEQQIVDKNQSFLS